MRVLLFVLTAWVVLSIPVAFIIGRVCGLYAQSSERLEPLIPSRRLPAWASDSRLPALQFLACERGGASRSTIHS